MEIDITKLSKLASGFTADVYILDDSKIVKVFFDDFEYGLIENEFTVNRLIHSYGIYIPRVYDIVDCDNRKGIIFQRLENKTLSDYMKENPKEYIKYSHLLASEHAKVNNVVDLKKGLHNQKEGYTKFINSRTSINNDIKNSLIEIMSRLPEDNKVCHGDFHPNNLLFENDDIFVIDWLGALRGNPLADVAGSYIIMKIMGTEAGRVSLPKKLLLLIFMNKFTNEYLKKYMSITGATYDEIRQWIPIRAATYLDVGLPKSANKKLLRLIKRELSKYK